MEVFDFDINNPHNNEEKENKCSYCGEPTDSVFCSRKCYRAELND